MIKPLMALFLSAAIASLIFSQNGPETTLDLTKMKWTEFQQTEKGFIGSPRFVEVGGDYTYVFDNKQYKILLFKNGKFDRYIGVAGQGPGELFAPISMKFHRGRIFVMNRDNKIYSFSPSSEYKQEFIHAKEALSDGTLSVSDFDIFQDKLIVTIEAKKDRVWIFDINGKLQKKTLPDDKYIAPNKGTYFTHPLSIHISEQKGIGIVVDRFNGEVTWINLNNYEIMGRQFIDDPKLKICLQKVENDKKLETKFISVSFVTSRYANGCNFVSLSAPQSNDSNYYEVSFDNQVIYPQKVLHNEKTSDFRMMKLAKGYYLIDRESSSIWAIN